MSRKTFERKCMQPSPFNITNAPHLDDDSSLVGECRCSYGQRHGQDPQHQGSSAGRGQAGV